MNPEFRHAKINEQEVGAQREAKRLQFMLDFIERNEADLAHAFYLNDKQNEPDFDQQLYAKTSALIMALGSSVCNPHWTGNRPTLRVPAEVGSPTDEADILLGLAKYSRPFVPLGETLDPNRQYRYFKFPTELAIKIVNDERLAIGDETFDIGAAAAAVQIVDAQAIHIRGTA